MAIGFKNPFQKIFETPDPKTVSLDGGTQGLINRQIEGADKPDEYFSGLLNQGMDSQQYQVAPELLEQQSQGKMEDPHINKAISRVYQQKAGKALDELKRQNEFQGKMMKNDYMNQTAQVLMRQQQNTLQNYQMLSQAYQAQEQARAQFINSLFQTGNQAMMMRGPTNMGNSFGGGSQSMGGGGSVGMQRMQSF